MKAAKEGGKLALNKRFNSSALVGHKWTKKKENHRLVPIRNSM